MNLQIPQIILILKILNFGLQDDKPWRFYAEYPSYLKIGFAKLSDEDVNKLAKDNVLCLDYESREQNENSIDIVFYSFSNKNTKNRSILECLYILNELSIEKSFDYMDNYLANLDNPIDDKKRLVFHMLFLFSMLDTVEPEKKYLYNLFKKISSVGDNQLLVFFQDLSKEEPSNPPLSNYKDINLRLKICSCLEYDVESKNYQLLKNDNIIKFLKSSYNILDKNSETIKEQNMLKNIYHTLENQGNIEKADLFINNLYFLGNYVEDELNLFKKDNELHSYVLPLDNEALINYLNKYNIKDFFEYRISNFYSKVIELIHDSKISSYSLTSSIEAHPKDIKVTVFSTIEPIDKDFIKKLFQEATGYVINSIQQSKPTSTPEFLEYHLLQNIPKNTTIHKAKKF